MSRSNSHKIVNYTFSTLLTRPSPSVIAMFKQKHTKKGQESHGSKKSEEKSNEQNYVIIDKSNNLLLHVQAKPGAKQNKITDVTSEGVGIQINAPATEGEANMELIKYISSVLGVRKSDINLERGFKSRQKVVKIMGNAITMEELKEKISNECETN